MADANMQMQWSDDQWNRVRQVVYEEARRARVAGNFLPLFGPLDADATYAKKQVLNEPGADSGLSVDDSESLKLATLQVRVRLRGSQVADPELSSALIAFRRAANLLARLEDTIVFGGQNAKQEPRWNNAPDDAPWQVLGGQESPGLWQAAKGHDGKSVIGVGRSPNKGPHQNGNELVGAVSQAIGQLEANYHLGPFACVFGQDFFRTAQTPPDSSLVLPQDRILPFLGGGPLLRSSVLKPASGMVIALGGAPIDLVVDTDISVNFLQVTTDPWFVFRVYEKIVLRINQPKAVLALKPM